MDVVDKAFTDDKGSTNSSLLTCAFNQDGGCLAIGTTSGFSVHNLYPQYAVSVNRELTGGVGLVEMLFRCNLMVLVGEKTYSRVNILRAYARVYLINKSAATELTP